MTLDILKYLRQDNMFPDTISVRKKTGSASFKGQISYATVITINVFIVGENRLVKNANGKEVMSNYHAVTDGYFSIKEGDEITLPSRFTPTVVEPVAVRDATDNKKQVNGSTGHHQTVFF